MATDPALVLATLGAALTPPAGRAPALALLSSDSRRRSHLWFVGLRGEKVCRWVVKHPRTDSFQDDLHSPLTSEAQFAALLRMSAHIESVASPLRSPTPVALLPDIGAFAMSFVAGAHIADLIRPASVLAPNRLLTGVAVAAGALRTIHTLEPPRDEMVDLRLVRDTSRRRLEVVLAEAGLELGRSGLDLPDDDHAGLVPVPQVVLHGDYAPENVMISGSTVYCLEPDLTHRGSPDIDVVRFVTMLFDAPLFVAGVRNPAVQRLRRRAAAEFLSTFYGEGQVSPAIRWLLAESLAARWATRHKDCLRRRPPLTSARVTLLRGYFGGLLAETGQPERLSAH